MIRVLFRVMFHIVAAEAEADLAANTKGTQLLRFSRGRDTVEAY